MPMFTQPVSLFPQPTQKRTTAPLGGDVIQAISPWSGWFTSGLAQYGLLNINLGFSSAPDVERDVLDGVASYGKQLGRIGDVLSVLLKHFDPKIPLTEDENNAIMKLKVMLLEIDEVKRQHGRTITSSEILRQGTPT